MRYYLDEDLSPAIAALLRARGMDATSAHEQEARGLRDEEQLERAVAEERCLVSRNRDDFLRLTRQWFADGRRHCGILIIPSSIRADRFSALANLLVEYDAKHPDGPGPYALDFL